MFNYASYKFEIFVNKKAFQPSASNAVCLPLGPNFVLLRPPDETRWHSEIIKIFKERRLGCSMSGFDYTFYYRVAFANGIWRCH